MTSSRSTPAENLPDDSLKRLLLSPKFLCLMAAAFLAYANISVFFGFVDYLRTLPVAEADYGLLIGALAAVSLIVRPLISPFCHSGNARLMLFLGVGLAACALAAYSAASGFFGILLVRCLHGTAFAVLGTALMTLIVDVIPVEKSAQFFGYLAVATLLPNTLVPPLLPFLEQTLGGFTRILLLFSILTLLIFPLVFVVAGDGARRKDHGVSSALSRSEIFDNLKDPRIIRILAAMLLLYCGHALVFFFLDGYGRFLDLAYAGIFLTLSTTGEIGIRVVAGSVFDRIDKSRLAAISLIALAVAYLLLAHSPGKGVFFSLGLAFGLGWGVAMPVFNGLMFDVSAPRVRAFNINLGLQMFQAGFFLGPLIGAPILTRWGYGRLYLFCGAMSLAAAVLMFMQGGRYEREGKNGR